MNSEKAKDFFSAYYEGTLEPGLVLNLEQKFKTDARLKNDYDAFASAFASLNDMRGEEIEVPIYLSDRIATRLEEARQQRRKSHALLSWPWMRVAPWALAGLAIVAAGAGIVVKGEKLYEGGFLPWMGHKAQVDGPSFLYQSGKVMLEIQGNHTVTVSDGVTGRVVRTLNGESAGVVQPMLTNGSAKAELFGIREDGGSTQMVSVPGLAADTSHPKGEGTLAQFALALSDYYHVPVLMENVKPETKMSWTFEGSNADQSAIANVDPATLSVGLREDGMLSINGH